MTKEKLEIAIKVLDIAIIEIKNKRVDFLCVAIHKSINIIFNKYSINYETLLDVQYQLKIDIKDYYVCKSTRRVASHIIKHGVFYELFENGLSVPNYYDLKVWALEDLKNKYINELNNLNNE